ncbi:hypothetical protein Bbelb_307580 [Branchiostoma belcheri]|nr:hypothetical protein Bbelb_307580 [Branchiostoma belcheri]
MAQLSRLAQLYYKISVNLTEDEVRDLRSLLAVDEILGKAKTEKARPLEIFNMLKDNGMIGKGNLGLLVQVLRCLGKGEMAEEAERLEQEHKVKERETTVMTAAPSASETEQVPTERRDSAETVTTSDSISEDTESEETTVKEIISTDHSHGDTATDVRGRGETSELASLHIRELERLVYEPMKALGPNEPDSSADVQDAKSRLETLLAELDTPAVMTDQEQQCVLYCLIDKAHAKAHNRLGLTYDMLGKNEEATSSHERVLEICRDVNADEVDICVAYKNLATSLTLSAHEAKSHLDKALQMAQEKGEEYGQMSVYVRMGDMQRDKCNSPRTAIHYYEHYLALARQLGDRREEGLAYNRLGHAHIDMREYGVALEWYQKHLTICKEIEHKKDEVTAHTAVGNAYRLLGKTEQATSHFDTALQLAQQTENLHGQMDVYCKIGDMQRVQLHSPRTAIQYYEQYLALARQLGDRHQEGWAYNRLGDTHVDIREYEPALEWYQKHLTISQEIGNKKDEVTVQTDVGNAYRLLGKTEQATSHFDTALQMAQQTENLHGQMDVYCKKGEMQREQLHSPRTAIQYYEQYLALARQLGDRHQEGWAYNRLGDTHVDIREYEPALEWYQKHLTISQEIGNKKDEVTVQTDVGNAYRLLGKTEQATSHFDTALQLAQQTENLHGQMEVYFMMGDMQKEQLHSPRTAIQYYEQHLALTRQLGDRSNEGLAYNKLGRAHYAMGEYENALKWDMKDLEIRQETVDKSNMLITHQNIADSYQALGKPDQARSHYQSALTIAMETGNKQEQTDIYLRLGDLHREQLHEPQVSHKYYKNMLALAMEIESKEYERLAYNRLGSACEGMQDNEAALKWHLKYLKMIQKDGDKTEQIIAHKNVAFSYRALGKLDQARSHYQSAMTIAMDTGSKQQQEAITNALDKLDQESSHSQTAMTIGTAAGSTHKQDITRAMGKLDQASSPSPSAMAIANKTGNEQEQKKNPKSGQDAKTAMLARGSQDA